MPLACLDEVRDPRLFEEVMRFHYMYFHRNPDVAKNYVDALRAKVIASGKIQKKESTWRDYLLKRLDLQGKTFREIRDEIADRSQQKTAFVSLQNMVSEGLVERSGTRHEYKYRLK